MFRDYYQYEIIEGAERKNVEKIPEAAFREAIANALIHRAWDIESQIRVLMFDDRLEVISPGGLPSGITEDEYLSGKISVLRNRNLANVFYRLGFVEIFGTGITRIKQLYESALRKPDFEVSENTIRIMLPVFEENINLTEDEKQVYALLSTTMLKPISEIAPYTPFGKSKTTQLLKEMSQKGVVEVKGKGQRHKVYNKTYELIQMIFICCKISIRIPVLCFLTGTKYNERLNLRLFLHIIIIINWEKLKLCVKRGE